MSNNKKKDEENNLNNLSFLTNNNNNNNGNANQKRGVVNKKGGDVNKKGGDVNKRRGDPNDLMMMESAVFIQTMSTYTLYFSRSWDRTPLAIKLAYLLILSGILYYFVVVKYNFYGMIVTALALFIILLLFNFYAGVTFLLLIIILIYYKKNERALLMGTLIKGTEIVKNSKPYDGMSDHLFIEAASLPNELALGTSSYSFWLYLNNPLAEDQPIYRDGEWKSIFYRGSPLQTGDDVVNLRQSMGVWIEPDNQTLTFIFHNDGSDKESIQLPNLEFNRWNYLTVCSTYSSVNIFLNGKLEVSATLNQNPTTNSNYGLYITSDFVSTSLKASNPLEPLPIQTSSGESTGFDGFIAYLSYYEYELNPIDVEKSMEIYQGNIESYEKFRISSMALLESPVESVPTQ